MSVEVKKKKAGDETKKARRPEGQECGVNKEIYDSLPQTHIRPHAGFAQSLVKR